MAIHHTHMKQAEKMGIILSETDDGVMAINHQYGVRVTAFNAKTALQDADAEIKRRQQAEYDEDAPAEDPEDAQPEVQRSEKGVPLDGATAFAEGLAAADNPYDSETEDDAEYQRFEQWAADFDEASEGAGEEEKGGSVVKEEYRARYAEAGHPSTCGDDLATILDNLCQTKSNGTDLERFEAICEANGISLAKYNRTSQGWQGRLRMTGRNMLARKVWENDGVLLTPVEGAEPQYKMSDEWMATRRFAKG